MLKALEEVGMLLDTSHLAEKAFWEALDLFQGQVLASHNCCRSLCDDDRQIDDRQIKALVERGAVIGTAFDAWMLSPSWDKEAMDNNGITFETVVDHMGHVCQLAGNARHVAIGSDLDGGYGKEQCPTNMDTIADLQGIPAILERRGYSSQEIENIMHANWSRLIRESLVLDGRRRPEDSVPRGRRTSSQESARPIPLPRNRGPTPPTWSGVERFKPSLITS